MWTSRVCLCLTDELVNEGDRIAQLVLEQIVVAQVEEVNELNDTERGSGGFGSTGV
jgi:dUTPase